MCLVELFIRIFTHLSIHRSFQGVYGQTRRPRPCYLPPRQPATISTLAIGTTQSQMCDLEDHTKLNHTFYFEIKRVISNLKLFLIYLFYLFVTYNIFCYKNSCLCGPIHLKVIGKEVCQFFCQKYHTGSCVATSRCTSN